MFRLATRQEPVGAGAAAGFLLRKLRGSEVEAGGNIHFQPGAAALVTLMDTPDVYLGTGGGTCERGAPDQRR